MAGASPVACTHNIMAILLGRLCGLPALLEKFPGTKGDNGGLITDRAARYIERLNLFAKEARNYSDIPFGRSEQSEDVHVDERAVRPTKQQSRSKARVPHKEKENTAARQLAIDKQNEVCCPRAPGAKNPLTMTQITPEVACELERTLFHNVDDVQRWLCAMGCHASRTEIQNKCMLARTLDKG